MNQNYLVVFIILFLAYIPCFIQKKEEDTLEIQTTELGAELISVKYKGVERLHDAKSFWNQHSPILFPIVGKLRYGVAEINGKEYAIPSHGFAMNKNFEKIGEHSYKLTSDEETLKIYPYQFELYVNYNIEKNKLFFNYKVINKESDQDMLFGIGGHPGFKCDFSKETSTIEFEDEEDNIKIIPVNVTLGIMSNEIVDGNTLIKNKKILEIKKDSFENNAIVFTDMKSKNVYLKTEGKNVVKFNYEGFKYLGIWSVEGAPYVCLEPWYNTPDYVNSTKNFSEKKDIIKLEPNGEFNISFSAEFYEYDENKSNSNIIKSLSLWLLLFLIYLF